VNCLSCEKYVNKELCREDGTICENCVKTQLETKMGIEIGHTFILEDKYTKALNATYLSKSGKPVVLQMGCYGIGVTRLIAASIEHLSSENEIRWPEKIAPFKVCIITPKEGSKEENSVKHIPAELYHSLESNKSLKDDIVIDDRNQFTIGKRLRDAQKLGIPFVVVVGAKASEPEHTLEVFHSNSGSTSELSLSETVEYIVNLLAFEEKQEFL
jgi:prolyl-tRNA synthetase